MDNSINITESLNNDYRSYARYVVFNRAIPAFSDGLKPVQRKILACAIKNCHNRKIKVSALAGKVMGDFDYHHGDTSCNSAIVVMNQEFMQGMPYLDKDGQYGWLYDKNAGAPRYIKTTLSGWSKLLFKDEAELTPKYSDDGDKIEPEYYLPILPMMLINGTDGIAVGYSTSFANLNPLEVAYACTEYLDTGKLPEDNMTPFVNGHTGLWSWFRGRYEHVAPWIRKNNTVITIQGLPINTTTEKFKGYLNQLIEQGQIKRFVDLSTNNQCVFDVHMEAVAIDNLIAENGVAPFFNLIHRLHKDNLVTVMPDGSIKRFDSKIQFIKEFVDFRLGFYSKRKERLIAEMEYRLKYLDSLIRFIGMVVNQELDLRGKNRKMLEAELATYDIMKEVLNEHMYNLTEDNIKKHNAEIARLTKELDITKNTTERQMYINDLRDLTGHIEKFYTIEPVLNVNNERLLRIRN